MKTYPAETAVSQNVYEQGRIDADADHATDILLDRIERAQAFRLYRGRKLQPCTLARLGMTDLVAVN